MILRVLSWRTDASFFVRIVIEITCSQAGTMEVLGLQGSVPGTSSKSATILQVS